MNGIINKLMCWTQPGASDFVGEVVTGFRAAEMGLMLVSADAGVQIETLNYGEDLIIEICLVLPLSTKWIKSALILIQVLVI